MNDLMKGNYLSGSLARLPDSKTPTLSTLTEAGKAAMENLLESCDYGQKNEKLADSITIDGEDTPLE